MVYDARLLTDFVSLVGLTAIAWIALSALGPRIKKYAFFLAGLVFFGISFGIDLLASVAGLTLELAYASDVTKLLAVLSVLAGVMKLRKAFEAQEKPARVKRR